MSYLRAEFWDNRMDGDLIVLVADKSMESAFRGLLERNQALHIRPIQFVLYVHPERDPGCLNRGHEFLRPWSTRFRHGLIVFDHHGCGREQASPQQLELEIQNRLDGSGWEGRATALVIEPELEVWVWNESPRVNEVLGWKNREIELRNWLHARGLWEPQARKPHDPKEALNQVLREVRKPKSASLFHNLSSQVGLDQCKDASFLSLKTKLKTWFRE